MDAYQVLVIVLSVMLGLLLVISGIFIFLLIKIFRQVRRITDKADHVMDGVESVSTLVGRITTPLALGKLLARLTKRVTTNRGEKNK